MNQNSRNKNSKYKVLLYMFIGIVFEIPAAFYCLNKITGSRDPVYRNLGCSYLFMFFYLIHYSLKEYKRSRMSRLNRRWGLIFLIIFFMNLFDFCIIFQETIIKENPNLGIDALFTILLIISLTQSIVTTIDFIYTFVKFLYNLIRNHRINSEIQHDLLIAAIQNNGVLNNNNRSINDDIRVGLILNDFEAENIVATKIEKFRVTNNDIISKRKEDEECTICLEFVMENSYENFALKIPCGHYFHFNCLSSLISINNKCPNCREVFV